MRTLRPSRLRSKLRQRACAVVMLLAVLLALTLVFLSYFNPDFALDLATRLWSCF
jgi:multisubunit Na+/H+ antiporter MnhB subunit